MNTIKILIGITIVILLSVLGLSQNVLKTSKEKTQSDTRIKNLEKRIEELKNLITTTQNQPLTSINEPSETLPNSLQEITKGGLSEIEYLKKELAESQQETLPEVTPILKTPKKNSYVVQSALVMATVAEFRENIAGLSVHQIGSLGRSQVLAIRRSGRIIGKVKISEVFTDQALADPIKSSFTNNTVDIRVDDELIIPPL